MGGSTQACRGQINRECATGMTDLYAVIGNPISHSQSPTIHAAFAKQTKQNIRYDAIEAPLDDFKGTIQQLIQQGFKGVNVTVPFKFEAFDLAKEKSARASAANAANTLLFDNKLVNRAENTDGIGLVRDITQNHGINLANKSVLLLGAGGAAEGVAQPIIAEQPALFVIANRSEAKAKAIAEKYQSQSHTQVKHTTFSGLHNVTFDVVINATSTGLSNSALPIPNSIFGYECLAYDMMYGTETPFMKQATLAKANVVDGLGMLVEQAAESFYLWRGVRPETAAVMDLLRES